MNPFYNTKPFTDKNLLPSTNSLLGILQSLIKNINPDGQC